MEESEKRKERLRAMRAGAPQSESVDDDVTSSALTRLLNPLIQPSTSSSGAERSPAASRFDYYTDPMSAYSGNKRSGPAHHPADNFSSPVHGSSPIAHLPSPSSAGQGRHYRTPPPVPTNHFQVNYSPHQGSYVTPSPVPQYGLWRSPVGMAGHFSGQNSMGMYSNAPASGLAQGSSRGIFSSPGFGRGVSPSASSGRGSLSADSGRSAPSANSGRGNSWRPGNYQSPCSGRSSRGGRGSKEVISASEYPGLFFRKLMVLDPWDRLEPVVGCILEPRAKKITPDSLKSWLPESIRAKKVKVTETASASRSQGSLATETASASRSQGSLATETASASRSQGSLAEYIALAFEEAVNDETAQ